MIYLFSQVGFGSERAASTVQNSLTLFNGTGDAWDRLWLLVVEPTQPVWLAAISIAQIIFGFSLFYYLYISIKNIPGDLSPRHFLAIMPLPLVVGLFLAGDGVLLAGLVRILRLIFQFFIEQALRFQIAGISISEAIRTLDNTAIANDQARAIFAECNKMGGTELMNCIQDPAKLDQTRTLLDLPPPPGILGGSVPEGIVNAAGNAIGLIANPPTAFVANAVSSVLTGGWLAIVQIILHAVQFVFINIVEAAALLTALSAPIFVSFSLFTIQAPLFALWLVNFIGLYFLQLAYISLVGFYALIACQLDQAGIPVGTTMLDLAFLFFIAIFSPSLSVAIALGGGRALYAQLSANAASVTRTVAFAVASFI